MESTRRKFIKDSSLGMMLIALHPEFCFAVDDDTSSTTNPPQFDLIKNIRLLTSTSLHLMKEFYAGTLGLRIESEKKSEITFIAGVSTLTFVKIDASMGDPWYHFAFNIPENKLLKARAWQLERTALILTPKRLRDSRFPDDVRYFRNWNAHSVFFWDPAGNLLEYIARHDLKNGVEGKFTSTDILNVSEIGFVVDDQEKEAYDLHNNLGIEVYPRKSNFWWAMGNENGLLLCLPKRLWGENTDNPRRFDVYKTEATIVGKENKEYHFSGFPYQVRMVRNTI
ncbi:VOC family protein [Aquimarina sp. 2304DJ70-9]|uniref:VOC family protein n=1 Tax=Aquimarina penaris TaxID=3231044 RepID=UPI003461BD8F